MKPIRVRRSSDRSRSDILLQVLALEETPGRCVGVSRPPSRCISVDLPEPLGPMMATNSPVRDPQADAAHRLHGPPALLVDLGDID